METINWAEYKARCTDKKGFTLTHYSKLFNAAHCRVNIKGLDFQLGFDERFYNEKEWNNQVDQFKDSHLENFVEITAEVVEEIKNTLSAYEAELATVKDYLATGLSGFEYNGAINKKSHLEMMVANYARMVELLPTFAADEDEKTGGNMTKLLKKDSVPFLKVLHKLTDKRFSFNIVHTFDLGVQGYNLEMSFMGDFVASCSIPEFHITTAVDCLIDLINYADKQNHSDYFDKFGVSFEIYHCKNLNGKNYYSFRKNEGKKWVKISDKVASYILEQNDIVINGLCDSVVSYCQYDCYYNVNLKGD